MPCSAKHKKRSPLNKSIAILATLFIVLAPSIAFAATEYVAPDGEVFQSRAACRASRPSNLGSCNGGTTRTVATATPPPTVSHTATPPPPVRPTVTTEPATNITQTGATLNGTITATGGANASTRGFAWGTNAGLSGGDTGTTSESGSFSSGSFTNTSLTLTCNTTYYARAYAANSAGVGMGGISGGFTTAPCPPTVTTEPATNVTQTGATLNGTITATGGANASTRGFAWGTNAGLSGGDTATTSESGSFGAAAFTNASLTLVCNTTYYARAYATNVAGTSLGEIATAFTTAPCPPTVSTEPATNITQTGATLNGTITATGGANATRRGFILGTDPTLTGGGTVTTGENGSFSTGAFGNTLTSLVCNTSYYTRAYGTNISGTGVGDVSGAFTTSACPQPTTGTLLAPLSGLLTGSPDLSTYLRGIAQLLIGLAGILAVIMIVYCGIQLMGTPSESGRSAAKECIQNAVLGILLAIGAWILLYTINPLLLSSELRLGDVAVAPIAGTPTTPVGTYVWSPGASCEPIRGKIVSVVPPSYCSGSAPSTESVCCGRVTSPLRERTGTLAVEESFTPTGTTGTAPVSSPTTARTPRPPAGAAASAPANEGSYANPDNVAPTVSISSPENNFLTTSATIPVTFTASDDRLIAHIEYVTASPGKAAQTGTICNGSCPSPTATMTVSVPVDATFAGSHAIEIRACDSRQCGRQTVIVETEAPCVSTGTVRCKTLPVGRAIGSPLCAPANGTRGVNVGAITDAYAFRITDTGGGGVLRFAGGPQDEYPPPAYVGGGTCGQAVCTVQSFNAGTQSVGCTCLAYDFDIDSGINRGCATVADVPNIIPTNVVVSISNSPGDLSSTPTTVSTARKPVSGYCGNGGSFGEGQLAFDISSTANTHPGGLQARDSMVATGGTIDTQVESGKTYKVHTFTSSDTFRVTSGSGNVEYLVIAGGGGGGGHALNDKGGGGGGAGGFVTNGTYNYNVSTGSYTVTVGSGGSGGGSGSTAEGTKGGNGGNSVFATITATGGGGGAGGFGGVGADHSGMSGGSGGGATKLGGGGGTSPSGQGNTGGGAPSVEGAAGGGGAGAVGGSPSDNSGAPGGAGRASTISGSSVTYAGGGGGGGAFGSAGGGGGGAGGGGAGGGDNANGTAGAPNTGGGGGGAGGGANDPRGGASGGSGIVIIKYPVERTEILQPGLCTVERDRTYYVNVTTVPFLGGGNPFYSLFWDFTL